jgi:hypothetical protein
VGELKAAQALGCDQREGRACSAGEAAACAPGHSQPCAGRAYHGLQLGDEVPGRRKTPTRAVPGLAAPLLGRRESQARHLDLRPVREGLERRRAAHNAGRMAGAPPARTRSCVANLCRKPRMPRYNGGALALILCSRDRVHSFPSRRAARGVRRRSMVWPTFSTNSSRVYGLPKKGGFRSL